MKKSATLSDGTADAGVSFSKQWLGYNIAQVDSYIDNLSGAYQEAFDEYSDKCAEYGSKCAEYDSVRAEFNNKCAEFDSKCTEYDGLLEKLRSREVSVQDGPKFEAIPIVPTKSEIVSRQAILDALADAESIITESRREIDKPLEGYSAEKAEMESEAKKILDGAVADVAKMRDAAKMALDAANVEADAAKEEARALVDSAGAEAIRIKNLINRNIEQANEAIEKIVGNMRSLMETGDAQLGKKPNRSYVNPYSVTRNK